MAWLVLFGLCLVMAVALAMLAVAELRARRRSAAQMQALSDQVGQRLIFRHPDPSDRAFYLEMAADPVASAANGWTGSEVEAVRKRFANRKLMAVLRAAELVAIERSTGRRIGTASFARSPIDPTARSVGIHVHPDHRTRGHGRDIMGAGILFLQQQPGEIHVGTRVTNLGMQRIMEQLGFTPEPEVRPFEAPNGESYEAYWYRCGADVHPPLGDTAL